MGVINDNNIWVDSIYLIELTDPVYGGESGTNNIQAKQLADRTLYLKMFFELSHTASGHHRLAGVSVADDAAITESKIAFSVPLSEIDSTIGTVQSRLVDLNNRLDDTVGIKGSMVSALGKAIPISWKNSERGFEFDMFSSVFTYIDETPVQVTQAIAGDDSIDVSSTEKLKVGNTYVLSDGFGENSEVVVLKEILTEKRILVDRRVTLSRNSGLFSLSSWSVGNSVATAKNGAVLITKEISILKNHRYGKFIARMESNGALITPYYKIAGETTWKEALYIEAKGRVPGYTDILYRISGGVVSLKLVVSAPTGVTARFDHLCVLPMETGGVAEAVKQPRILSPADMEGEFLTTGPITLSEYRSLYGLSQKAVQVQVATDSDFTNVVWDESGTNDTSFAIPYETLETASNYYVRTRQQDEEDFWSRWSATVYFSTGALAGVIDRPTAVFPGSGSTNIATTLTFTANAFSATPTDTHTQTRWQVSTTENFSNIVHDSGFVSPTTTYTIPDGILEESTVYFWRVRYKGTILPDSEWSMPARFTTRIPGGEYSYTSAGVFNWTVPAKVTAVSVVAAPGTGTSSFGTDVSVTAGTNRTFSGNGNTTIPVGVTALSMYGKGADGGGTYSNGQPYIAPTYSFTWNSGSQGGAYSSSTNQSSNGYYTPTSSGQTYTSTSCSYVPGGTTYSWNSGSSGGAYTSSSNKSSNGYYTPTSSGQTYKSTSCSYVPGGTTYSWVVDSTSTSLRTDWDQYNGYYTPTAAGQTYFTRAYSGTPQYLWTLRSPGTTSAGTCPGGERSLPTGKPSTTVATTCRNVTTSSGPQHITAIYDLSIAYIHTITNYKSVASTSAAYYSCVDTTYTSVASTSAAYYSCVATTYTSVSTMTSAGQSYIAPSDSRYTGASTIAKVGTNTYTFPGGYAGPATGSTKTVTLAGTSEVPFEHTVPSGGQLSITYDPKIVGTENSQYGSSFNISGETITSGSEVSGGVVVWKNAIQVTPGSTVQVRVGTSGGVRIIWGHNKSFPNNAA